MNKRLILLVIFSLVFISLVNAGVDSINYPYNNDVLSYSARINLNVSSSASTGCYFTYDSGTGSVAYNQSISCDGISLVNLPNSNGIYNLTVWDDGGSSQTIKITIDKPSGILISVIYVLTFFVLLSMLFLVIINLAKLATTSTTIMDVALSFTVYFALLIAYQLVLEYSAVPFVINWLDLIMSIASWVLVVLPLLSFIITFFVKGTQKRKLLSVQELTGGRNV